MLALSSLAAFFQRLLQIALPDPVFLSGPLARFLPGKPIQVRGYALPDDAGCFPLPVPRKDAVLDGVLSDAPGAALLAQALSVRTEVLPGGAVIHLGEADGTWDGAGWAARWSEIAPLALAEMLGYVGTLDAASLRRRLPMILARAHAQVAARSPMPADIRSDTSRDRVDVLHRDTPHAGFFLTQSYDLRHPRFDGRISPVVTREVFVATDAAIVLPYDAQRDRVLLVEQFRMGPFGRGDTRPWMLEPVAGRVDASEAPENTARRECEEEAGLTLTALEHIASHYCSPGCSTEYFHCYLGLTDLPELREGHGGLSTEQEDIRTHVLSFGAAYDLLRTGEADNGPLILMLMWLNANRPRLRASA